MVINIKILASPFESAIRLLYAIKTGRTSRAVLVVNDIRCNDIQSCKSPRYPSPWDMSQLYEVDKSHVHVV